MKVIKGRSKEVDIQTICGEMLNLEYSIKHYVNGQPLEAAPVDYDGYPQKVTNYDVVKYQLVQSILYSADTTDAFIAELYKCITEMESSLVRLDGKKITNNQMTIIPLNKCPANLRARKNDLQSRHVQVSLHTLIHRTIRSSHSNTQVVRFAWTVLPLEVTYVNTENKQSIVYDKYNNYDLQHNCIGIPITTISISTKIISRRLTLINYSINPLLIAINQLLCNGKNKRTCNVLFSKNRLYPDGLVKTPNIISGAILPDYPEDVHDKINCHSCNVLLYDYNYETVEGNVVCTHCYFYSSYKITRIVKSPISLHFLVHNMLPTTDEWVDVYKECLKGITPLGSFLDPTSYLIGDKYIGLNCEMWNVCNYYIPSGRSIVFINTRSIHY